jgi:hypothetical protein
MDMGNVRMPVRVLIVVGDQAELTTPDRDYRDPERVPASMITRDTGLSIPQMPGKQLTALVDERGELVGFER